MRQLSNRVRFGQEEDTTSDGLLGVGMLGKGQQTGKARASPPSGGYGLLRAVTGGYGRRHLFGRESDAGGDERQHVDRVLHIWAQAGGLLETAERHLCNGGAAFVETVVRRVLATTVS